VIDSSRCKHDPPTREFNSHAPDIDAQSRASNPHAHNTLGAKNEARALFGPDSDQVASQGLKKKSERSKPKRVFG
jgi:hypothetical protein